MNVMKMIDFMKTEVLAAAEICLKEQRRLTAQDISYKGPKDLLSPIDTRVEQYLTGRIKETFPEHDIIGEELGADLSGARYCWLIDPIDGTTSYCHGQTYYSISVGLKELSETVGGVVCAPALGQMFHAVKGQGTFLDGQRVNVSSCTELESAVLATGFACLRAGKEHNNLKYLNRLLPVIRDIRRCGSAAIDLAYVAAGFYDGFWELNLNNYDIAAGALLVEEAGGTVTDISGADNYPDAGIVATNGRIQGELSTYFI